MGGNGVFPGPPVAWHRIEAWRNGSEVTNIHAFAVAGLRLHLKARRNGRNVINVPAIDVAVVLHLDGDC